MPKSVVPATATQLLMLVVLQLIAAGLIFLAVWWSTRELKWYAKAGIAVTAWTATFTAEVIAYAFLGIDNYLVLPEWTVYVCTGAYTVLCLLWLVVGLLKSAEDSEFSQPEER